MNKSKTEQQKETEEENERVDEASEESFPASDSPSFTPITHAGPPQRKKTEHG